ncbi:linear gramicidin synthetase subunit D domain protein [Mycobacterium intracellulare 1956]|uniref:Linear gramicidin synthetase subunit D domain protein n=1 Tax=Mycobacterium intracellulare 1956 TaxID=1299331 RepID=X8CX66_MYCIT|nr:linear gramicidin synthetase subunit D domain protein [Mycobacterium intracellulare 1956]
MPLADALAQADAGPDATVAEELHRLGERAGYGVAVTWGAQRGTLSAVFIASADQAVPALTDLYLAPDGPGGAPSTPTTPGPTPRSARCASG